MSADDLQHRLLAVVAASGSLLRSPQVDDVIPAVLRIARDLVAADGYAVWRLERQAWRIRSFDGVSRDLREPRRHQQRGCGRLADSVQRSLHRRGRALRARTAANGSPSTRGGRPVDDVGAARPDGAANVGARALLPHAASLYRRRGRNRTRAGEHGGRRADDRGALRRAAAHARAAPRFSPRPAPRSSDSLEFETTLNTVARLAVPGIGDSCAIHLIDEDERSPAGRGRARRSVEVGGDGNARQPRHREHVARLAPHDSRGHDDAARGYRRRPHRAIARGRSGAAARVRRGPVHQPDLGAAASRAGGPLAASPSRSAPARGAMATPTCGWPKISRSAPPSPSTTPACTAPRSKAKPTPRSASSRARFLADVGETLASSLDYETTLKTVASLAVPDIADWCTVDIVDEHGDVQRLAVAHVDPQKAAPRRNAAGEVSGAARRGRRRAAGDPLRPADDDGGHPRCARRRGGARRGTSPRAARDRPHVLHLRAADDARPRDGRDHVRVGGVAPELRRRGSAVRAGSGVARRARGRERPRLPAGERSEPAEGRVPRHAVARAAHAAERDPRLRPDAARRGVRECGEAGVARWRSSSATRRR